MSNPSKSFQWLSAIRRLALYMLPLIVVVAVAAVPHGEVCSYVWNKWPTGQLVFLGVELRSHQPVGVTLHYRVSFRDGSPAYEVTWVSRLQGRVYADEEEERIGGWPLIEIVSDTARHKLF